LRSSEARERLDFLSSFDDIVFELAVFLGAAEVDSLAFCNATRSERSELLMRVVWKPNCQRLLPIRGETDIQHLRLQSGDKTGITKGI
jgi:hypothetical protein